MHLNRPGCNQFYINGTQQFKVNKTLTAEINGRYRNGWLKV